MTSTLTFNPLRAMIMSYSHASVQGQRSVGSADKVATSGRTDEGDCITSHANAVGNDTCEIPLNQTTVVSVQKPLGDNSFIAHVWQRKSDPQPATREQNKFAHRHIAKFVEIKCYSTPFDRPVRVNLHLTTAFA